MFTNISFERDIFQNAMIWLSDGCKETAPGFKSQSSQKAVAKSLSEMRLIENACKISFSFNLPLLSYFPTKFIGKNHCTVGNKTEMFNNMKFELTVYFFAKSALSFKPTKNEVYSTIVLTVIAE